MKVWVHRTCRMGDPREVLNRLKWDPGGGGLAGVVVAYVHRGAPDDTAVVQGAGIADPGPGFMTLASGASIPYHRILRIEREGAVLWARRGPGDPPVARD